MEVLKLDLNNYWNLMLPIILLILMGGILGIKYKSQVVNFEKYVAFFKCIFYLLLAGLTLSLDVTVVNNVIKSIEFIIPDKLTIGQLLLITLSVLEAGSNLIDFLKVQKSESHLFSKEEFWKYQNDDFPKRMKIHKRIYALEKEIESIKKDNLTTYSFRKKKKRGKRRKK